MGDTVIRIRHSLSPNILPFVTKTGNPEICNTNPSHYQHHQPSQRASILQSTKPVNQNTNTFPYINDGRVVVWLIQTILYWLVIQLQVQRITIYNMLMDGLMGSEGLDHWPGPGLWHQAINTEMEIPPDNKYHQQRRIGQLSSKRLIILLIVDYF